VSQYVLEDVIEAEQVLHEPSGLLLGNLLLLCLAEQDLEQNFGLLVFELHCKHFM
jgi:hypothetical protein